MTAVMDAPAGVPAAEPVDTEPVQLVRIRANLLPDEVIAARRLSKLKRRLGIAIAAIVVFLAAVYAYSWWQTNNAQDDLASVQFDTQNMTAKVQNFGPLVDAQAKTAQIQAQLKESMTNDLQWSKLMATLNESAGSSVQITSFAAQITAGGAAGAVAADPNPLNTSGLVVVGNLNLTGTAADYRTVAAFVDTLSTVKGLAVVDPAQVTGIAGRRDLQRHPLAHHRRAGRTLQFRRSRDRDESDRSRVGHGRATSHGTH